MRKITILHLLSRFGGDYPLFNQVVQGLNPDTYRHIVLYLRGPVPDNEALRMDGFDVRELPYRRKDLRRFRPKIVRRLRRIVKGEGVDIIHAHRHKPTVYASLAAMGIKGVKVVSTVHGMNLSRTPNRKLTNRLLWPRMARVVAVSEAVREDILTCNSWYPPEKAITIHNGIDVARYARPGVSREESRKFFGLPPDGWLWGTAGRLRPVKCHDILLSAWAKGGLGRLGGHLAIAGSGDLRPQLEALAERLKIDQEVHFLGQIWDIPKFLAGLDGFVFPSRREGLGLALIEAMAAGLPVVATAAGGTSEVIEPLHKETNAFLVPPEQPEPLSKAMSDVMKWNKSRMQASRDATQKRAGEFDMQFMIRKVDSLYKDLIGDN